ncbi:N-terminal phage integrase SAM-like domain-containing protein [Nocardioides campestrisoli]|uniref:N-terminal phage integrase SAM-like domain-containing protein n=1 Tax=Nocardioides campestrisoli TaxID=2736757 RepID=UPI0015E6EA41
MTADGEVLRHSAPHTFDTKGDAEAWLADERRLIVADTWTAPSVRRAEHARATETFVVYAERWLKNRKVKGQPLVARTIDHYQYALKRFILPTFGLMQLRDISPAAVADWYDTTAADTPTSRAHALLPPPSDMRTAADPTKHNGTPLIPYNPCGISGGDTSGKKRNVRPATLDEIVTIVSHMPERSRLRVLLADSCALRFGELAELRRMDVERRHPRPAQRRPPRLCGRGGQGTEERGRDPRRSHPPRCHRREHRAQDAPRSSGTPRPDDGSPARTVATWPRRVRSTARPPRSAAESPTPKGLAGSKPGASPNAKTFASTTYAMAPSPKPPATAPPSPSAWHSAGTPPVTQPCATNRPPRTASPNWREAGRGVRLGTETVLRDFRRWRQAPKFDPATPWPGMGPASGVTRSAHYASDLQKRRGRTRASSPSRAAARPQSTE